MKHLYIFLFVLFSMGSAWGSDHTASFKSSLDEAKTDEAASIDAGFSIVFACKSNSCRSQMAEAWGKVWIQNQLNQLEEHHTSRKNILENIFVESLALDSSDLKNKVIKHKAILALAQDGVDISGQRPSGVPETLQKITLRKNLDDPSHTSLNHSKVIDILVLMCNCKDNMNKDLFLKSNVVFDLKVDAPTAFAMSGEGDQAYLRVSRDIRTKVFTIMDEWYEDLIVKFDIEQS